MQLTKPLNSFPTVAGRSFLALFMASVSSNRAVRPQEMFKDEFKPTEKELRLWAKDEENLPDQDFDLKVTSTVAPEVILKLADEDSPNRKFFLACLYLLSGICVRNRVDTEKISNLRAIFKMVPPEANRDIHLWVKRSEKLFAEPEKFEYNNWCNGALAYRDNEN